MPFTLAASRDADLSLRLRWTIAPGTDLLHKTPGETKDDPNSGPIEIDHGTAEAVVPADSLAGVIGLRVTYRGCAEKGICYPPLTRVVEVPALVPLNAAVTADVPADTLSPAEQAGAAGRGVLLCGTDVLAMARADGTLDVVTSWSGRNLQVALQTRRRSGCSPRPSPPWPRRCSVC